MHAVTRRDGRAADTASSAGKRRARDRLVRMADGLRGRERFRPGRSGGTATRCGLAAVEQLHRLGMSGGRRLADSHSES
ncbi:hypothetical protein GCM10010421_08350 [Streptomyces glaucus]|uniref:Secreted protein n=1 Tax=Streptomyces glaucus TaxID=284029 RepID=A0ABP5WBZ5_9ACTN